MSVCGSGTYGTHDHTYVTLHKFDQRHTPAGSCVSRLCDGAAVALLGWMTARLRSAAARHIATATATHSSSCEKPCTIEHGAVAAAMAATSDDGVTQEDEPDRAECHRGAARVWKHSGEAQRTSHR